MPLTTCAQLLLALTGIAYFGANSAEEGVAVGRLRVMSYGVISPMERMDRCAMSLMTTISMRSRIECATGGLRYSCSLYQYNTTTRQFYLFSDKRGGGDLLDDSPFFSTENYREEHADIGLYVECWLLFVWRQDGSVDFNRTWADYRDGFGNRDGEFWLGLETLHSLTADQPYKLRAEMTDWNGTEYFAEYSTFQVGSKSEGYTLRVSGFNSNSTAGESMSYHNGYNFTTLDADNDIHGQSCALTKTGGWWHKDCAMANPTGSYQPEGTVSYESVHWMGVPGLDNYYSFKTMKMMIKL